MAKDVIKTQVFDSSKMKQQKENSCFNGSRRPQELTREERVIDAKDVQMQSGGAAERRGSGDVRVDDAFTNVGSNDVREAAGERRRVDVMRSKPGFMGRGEVRRKDHGWQDDRELVKDRIHVNGIPPEVGEHELGDFFSAFGRVKHVAIIPVNAGFGFAQQRFFPPRLRYGFVTFFRGEAVVQHILKKEALVLRGYRLYVSPARERRMEVLERRQSEGKEGDRHHQGAAPAPGSSRDCLKEQPSWRTMDGQGRALADHQGRGQAMKRNGKGGRHQGDHSGNLDRQPMARSFSQHPSSSHPVHHQMEPPIPQTSSQFAAEPLHYPVTQEGFAMASSNEGLVPGMVNSAGTTPYIFYQQPVHPAAPYVFYHHGPMPVPYYPPMSYHHQPEMVPYSPAPQQQSELAPLYISQQPQSDPGQFLQPPAWQEMNYTIPATPLWQPGDPSVQQQYCVYQQQQPQLVPLTSYGGAPAAHFDPLLVVASTEQVPQQQMESQGQVETSSLSLPMRHFHPEEGEAAGKDRADWDDGGSSKGGWRPRFEPSSA